MEVVLHGIWRVAEFIFTIALIAVIAAFAFGESRWYLVSYMGVPAKAEMYHRLPSNYGLSGGEVGCELRANRLRELRLDDAATCERVALPLHWLYLTLSELQENR